MSHVFIQFNAVFYDIFIFLRSVANISQLLGQFVFLFFLLSACSRETVPERVTVPHISFIFTWQVLHCAETSQCLVGLSRCPSVSATLPLFSCSLCYPVVLVSFGVFGLVVCLAISMEAPALHVINNIISRRQEDDANYVSVSLCPSPSPSSTPAPTTTGSACCCCLLAVL